MQKLDDLGDWIALIKVANEPLRASYFLNEKSSWSIDSIEQCVDRFRDVRGPVSAMLHETGSLSSRSYYVIKQEDWICVVKSWAEQDALLFYLLEPSVPLGSAITTTQLTHDLMFGEKESQVSWNSSSPG